MINKEIKKSWVIVMGNGGINNLSASQIKKIRSLANNKGSGQKLLVAKFKGKKVKFSAVKPNSSYGSKQEKPVPGTELAGKIFGLKDRQISPALAHKIINIWKASKETRASLENIKSPHKHPVDNNLAIQAKADKRETTPGPANNIYGDPAALRPRAARLRPESISRSTCVADTPPPLPPRPPWLSRKKQPFQLPVSTDRPNPDLKFDYSAQKPAASKAELLRLCEDFDVDIETIKINGSPAGYIFSNKRTLGEPMPTTLLVEAHAVGFFARGGKLPPFTTPENTRFLMTARRNQHLDVDPRRQAEAISKGQIDFRHDDQIYGSLTHGSGISMTNYRLMSITEEEGKKSTELSLKKTAALMQSLKKSAHSNDHINSFNILFLDPNLPGILPTEDLMGAFAQQGINYKDIIMNVCRPQQKGEVGATDAWDNCNPEKRNLISQMGLSKRSED